MTVSSREKGAREPYIFCHREDGRIEWICEHGVGHTIRVPAKYVHKKEWYSHGCDGCCSPKNKEYRNALKLYAKKEKVLRAAARNEHRAGKKSKLG